MMEIFPELKESYGDIFFRLYTPTNSLNLYTRFYYPYDYTNWYRLQEFETFDQRLRSYKFKEYVFACVIKKTVEPFGLEVLYVSKEYNLADGSYRPGRFVIRFRGPLPFSVLSTEVYLAEVPAEAVVRPDFNVELHYLRIREFRRPGKVLWYCNNAISVLRYHFLL